MIAHVAEAGERRGRVLLRISGSPPNPFALAAAVHIAAAYHSEIEGLFISDEQVFDMAAFSFSRVISPAGRDARHLSEREVARAYRAIERTVTQRLRALAEAREVPCRCRSVRDDPLRALTAACAERGPWNVVTLAESVDGNAYDQLAALLETVRDVTALVIVGPAVRRMTGPVVVVLDEASALTNAMRAAARLASASDGDGDGIILMLVGPDDAAVANLEGDARLALAEGDHGNVRLEIGKSLYGAPAAIAEAIRRERPGFVVARFASLLVPDRAGLRDVLAALECPLFLSR